MVEEDLGEATIVYEDPDDGTIERTVQNEHVAYFQDHWIVKIGEEEDAGRDRVRRIPANRVYYVERSVEEFESEISTIADQVRSLTDDLREKLPGGEPRRGRERRERRERRRDQPVNIEVESEAPGEGQAASGPDDGDS